MEKLPVIQGVKTPSSGIMGPNFKLVGAPAVYGHETPEHNCSHETSWPVKNGFRFWERLSAETFRSKGKVSDLFMGPTDCQGDTIGWHLNHLNTYNIHRRKLTCHPKRDHFFRVWVKAFALSLLLPQLNNNWHANMSIIFPANGDQSHPTK